MTTLPESEAQTNNVIRIQLDEEGYAKPLEQHTQFVKRLKMRQMDSVLLNVDTSKPLSGVLEIFFGKDKAEIRPYTNGLLSGTLVKYYDDGKKMIQVSYLEGKREGESLGFYQDGKIAGKELYQNGLLQTLIGYHENGTVDAEYDRTTGVRKRYYDTGSINALDRFAKNGKPDKGELPEYTVYYYKNGHRESEGKEEHHVNHYHDEEGHGDQQTIFRVGHWIYYYESTGHKKEEGAMGIGGRHADVPVRKGQWKAYNEKGKLVRYDYYEGMFDEITRSEPAKE